MPLRPCLPARPSPLRRGLVFWPASAGLCGLPRLAEAANRAPGELLLAGTGSGLGPLQKALGTGTRLRFLPNLGTGGGLKALAAGAIDIALSARAVNEAERASGLVSREFFRTPYVFAVHASVPAQNLALADLVPLYAGRTQQWAPGVPVRLVLRPESDSDTQFVKRLLPAMAEALAAAHARSGAYVAATDGEAVDALERSPGSLGISTLGLLRSEGRRIKALALDGVVPDADTLMDRRYPHAKTVHLVTRGQPAGDVAEALKAVLAKPVLQGLQALGCVHGMAA